MKNLFSFVLLAGVFLLLESCTGHKNVVREINAYSPPALYQAVKTTASVPELQEKTPEDTAFEIQKEKIEALKIKWLKTEHEASLETGFYSPDPERIKMISMAFTEDLAAEKILSDSFLLKDLEILILERNPLIEKTKNEFKASLEAYDQVSVLDDIIRTYSSFNSSLMTGVGNMEDMESIYKKFPFPGILSLKGAIVNQEAKIAWISLDLAKRDQITQARIIFYELFYNDQAQKITRQTLGLLEDLESSVTRNYETGLSRLPELTRVKIQKEKIKEELITLSEIGHNIRKSLKAALLLPDDTQIGKPSILNTDKSLPLPDVLTNIALTHRQELNKLQAMITRMELMIEMAETQIYPGFTQNLSLTANRAVTQAGTRNMEDPFKTSTTASEGYGLPKMPWTGLFDSYLRETRERLSALKSELKGAQAQTAWDVRTAWVAADQARREFDLFNDRVKALSDLNFSVSSKAYESGDISFSETMDAVLLMFETRLLAERKKADMEMSLSRLCQTIGTSDGF